MQVESTLRYCASHNYAGILAVTGMLLLWFRLTMNYNSEPIFKPYELKAAYHENRSVR